MKKITRLLTPALLTVLATGCVAVGSNRGDAGLHECDPEDEFLFQITATVIELVLTSICD